MSERTTYGKFDKFIHWLMAINVGLTLVFARDMSHLPIDERVIEYGQHGASVTTIAICLVIRAIWRAIRGFPVLPEAMVGWQVVAAKLVHYGLYVAMFAQIIAGVLLASTTERDFIALGYNINYSAFNLVADSNYDLMLDVHETIYNIILLLLLVHVVAALKHHFVDKDNVLKRMLPFVKVDG